MNFYYETVFILVDPKKPIRNQIGDPNYGNEIQLNEVSQQVSMSCSKMYSKVSK